MSELMSNYFVLMFIFGLGALLSGYIGYLAWFRHKRFLAIIEKRMKPFEKWPMASWTGTKSYLWFVRIQTLFLFVVMTGLFLMGIIGPIISS